MDYALGIFEHNFLEQQGSGCSHGVQHLGHGLPVTQWLPSANDTVLTKIKPINNNLFTVMFLSHKLQYVITRNHTSVVLGAEGCLRNIISADKAAASCN